MWHGVCFTCQKRPNYALKETCERDLHVSKETNGCLKETCEKDLWKRQTWRGRSRFAWCDMVCASHVKRDQYMYEQIPMYFRHVVSEKNPIFTWNESYDLHIWNETYERYDYRSLLQNIVSFIGLFCKRDLWPTYMEWDLWKRSVLHMLTDSYMCVWKETKIKL